VGFDAFVAIRKSQVLAQVNQFIVLTAVLRREDADKLSEKRGAQSPGPGIRLPNLISILSISGCENLNA
jgi:hypothetical protein